MQIIKLNHLSFLYIGIILLCPFCCPNTPEKNESTQINEITIIYQDLYTLTTIRVESKDFEKIFANTLKTKTLRKPEEIEKILSYVNKALKNNQRVDNIDVRFKMILKSTSSKDKIIYGNARIIQIEDKQYIIDNEFSNFLLKITESK